MTREQIIAMAREAELHCHVKLTENGLFTEDLEYFAALVAAAEREAIIDIVAFHGGSVEIEAAIRARGEK